MCQVLERTRASVNEGEQAYLGYIHTGGILKSPFLIDSELSTPILTYMLPNLFHFKQEIRSGSAKDPDEGKTQSQKRSAHHLYSPLVSLAPPEPQSRFPGLTSEKLFVLT